MKLQEKRKEKGFSQSQLSALSDIPIRTIQHYEQGTKDINKAQVVTVLKLADALGCDIKDILELGEK
ncbi:helix-turn-helix domain-containing protein [Anaerosacchariphilus polymeriproducens]|uniref:XRE family transcriptional regulator n=1 Tax=Anaerosacchariphilus polymeriproducens TaxID=1812858 RepID=A0A371ATF2_9FIRM|nr:helix-turn-helix transcriptional regulator [Anaerosacchariphilus polymeriproducens]RDU22750.1 XRE family transcriptional regulator [Anaerosacchariphilus polymeriproducens]